MQAANENRETINFMCLLLFSHNVSEGNILQTVLLLLFYILFSVFVFSVPSTVVIAVI